MQRRFDFAKVRSKPVRTPQGFLRVDANLTRVGVLVYKRADGTEIRELRLPEEVFKADSLLTLANAPITDLHPAEGMVTPENIRELSRGVVTEQIKADGDFVTAPVIVQDSGMIAMVESGKRREVSCGYLCQVEMTPGEWRGEKYDRIQRNIVYNHLAFGPVGWARAGSEVALRMDSGLVSYDTKATAGESNDPWYVDKPPSPVYTLVTSKLAEMNKSLGHLAEKLGVDRWAVSSFINGEWGAIRSARSYLDPDAKRPPETGLAKSEDFTAIASFIGVEPKELFDLVPVTERGDGKETPAQTQPTRNTMETIKITVDGVEYEIPKAHAPHLEKAIKAKEVAATTAAARADEQAARADGLAVQVADLTKRLADAESPERLDGLVKERTSLEVTARKILGADAKLDGKDAKAIKVECIAKVVPTFDSKDKSDVYIQARFDGIVETLDKETATQADRTKQMETVLSARRGDGDLTGAAEKAAAAAKEDSRNAWRQPLAMTR